MLPYITGQVKESPRQYFFYVSDDGGIMAVRQATGNWYLRAACNSQRRFGQSLW